MITNVRLPAVEYFHCMFCLCYRFIQQLMPRLVNC